MNFRDVNGVAYVLLTTVFTEQYFLTPPLPPNTALQMQSLNTELAKILRIVKEWIQ